MKFYDKKLTKVSDNIKNIIFMLIVFIIGFLAGYFITHTEKKSNDISPTPVVQNYDVNNTISR